MVSSPLVFPVGSMNADMRCIDINITDDTVFEGVYESFTVGLTVMTSGVMQGNSTTTISITENDGICSSITLAS